MNRKNEFLSRPWHWVVMVLFWLPCSFSAFGMGRGEALPEKVRVLVLKSATNVHLEYERGVVVSDAQTRAVIARAGWLNAHAEVESGLIRLGGLRTGVREVLIVPQNARTFIAVEGKRYRGAIRLAVSGGTSVAVTNELTLDHFLYGVVGREVPAGWPAAALEAQAIAARSFAVDRIRMQARKAYDIEANVTLAYGGVGAETASVRAAVDSTRRQVLVYKGEVLPAYFSSTCGGRSEEIRWVYPETGAFPHSVRCDWCKDATFYQWSARYSWSDLEAAMHRIGAAGGKVKAVRVAKKTSTGRAAEIEIRSDSGTKTISSHKFRVAMGVDKLRSTWFSMSTSRGELHVSGKGWGHGIGLCQNGAGGLAKKGWSAKKILLHYYPGAAVRTM